MNVYFLSLNLSPKPSVFELKPTYLHKINIPSMKPLLTLKQLEKSASNIVLIRKNQFKFQNLIQNWIFTLPVR